MSEKIKLRTFEAFAGYGSQLLALRRLESQFPDKLEVEPIGFSEIDKYAIQAYKALHGDVKNYGDISKIDWSQVPDFDLFTYSSPCFTEGTLVMTEKGLKRIEEITSEDMVLTHTNTFKNVVKPMVKRRVGKMYNIKAMCFDNLDCTPEHPFYVREMRENKGQGVFNEPEWVEAKNLSTNHYLGVAINQESRLPAWNCAENHPKETSNINSLLKNRNFWHIIGWYVACGWRKRHFDNSCYVIFDVTHRTHTVDALISSLHNCGFQFEICREHNTLKVQISSNELYDFVSRYGDSESHKRIDGETLNLPILCLSGFFDGYFDSAGNVNDSTYKLPVYDKELAYSLCACIAKVYKVPYTIKRNVITSYVTVSFKPDTKRQNHAFYENGYIWYPISSMTLFDADCHVYNMEVDTDNSYTANGCIVHNCQDISVAGNQAGLEEGSNTRSSLLWECQRAITEKRPKFLLLENVAALVSQKFMPYFFRWFKTLEDLGYSSTWQVLNAKDYGVPQNRERVFLVSIRNDVKFPYYFPLPFKLEKRLKDVLEDTVDEKYYLNDVQIESKIKSSYVQRTRIGDATSYSDTLCARDYKEPKCVKVNEG